MKRKNISSGSPLEPIIGFSRAVRTGNVIAVSGTAPLDRDGRQLPKDLYGQSLACLKIIQRAIEESGGQLHHVVRTRVYIKNMQDWRQAAEAHGLFFGEIRPACTFLGVTGFIDPDWLVEIEADCIL